MRNGMIALTLAATVGLGALPASAQESRFPELVPVGEMAPDFSLPGATREGVLTEDVRLSEYRGQVVVLAFFFRARTRG